MSPDSNLLFATLLAIILLSLLTLLIVSWFRTLRSYTVNKIIETIHKYREFHTELKNLVKGGIEFKQYNQEPYTTEVRKHLTVQKRSIENILISSGELRQILHEIPTRSGNFFLVIVKAIFFWPFQWFGLKRRIETLFLYLDDNKHDIAELHKSLIHLQELPWEISIEVRELHQINLEACNILQGLYNNHVVGGKFTEAIKHYKWLYSEFQKFPKELCNGNKGTILGLKDSVALTVKTFEIIQIISQPSKIFLSKVRQWRLMYDDSAKALDRLLHILSKIPRLFDDIPNGINATKERWILTDLTNETLALQNAQHQPTIETLEEYTKQTFEVITKTEKLSDILVKSQANYRKLIQQFGQIDQKLTRLNKVLYEQATRKDYPIQWSETKSKIGEIENVLSELGTIETQRTTDELEIDIEHLDQINNNLSIIEEATNHIESLSEDLRQMWQECAARLHAKWLPSIEQLTEDTNKYSNLNWTSNDNVEGLCADAKNLLAFAKSILPTVNTVSLPEGQIEEMLSNSKNLLDRLLVMEERKQRIYATLVNIQQLERNSKRVIKRLLPALDVIMPEIAFEEIPLDATEYLINLDSDGKALNAEIAISKNGIISEKATRVKDWERDVYQAMKTLMSALQDEIDEKQNQISDWLKTLSTYARSIIDPAVDRIQQYQPVNVYAFDIESIYQVDLNQSCQHLIDFAQKYKEIKYCCDEFESAILQPLDVEYSEVMKRKDDAENLFRKAQKVFERSWPPIDEHLDLNENKVDLDNAEELLKTIRRQKQTVYNLINGYIELKMRYLDTLGDIQSKLNSDKDFQRRFRAIEEDAKRRLREMAKRQFGTNSEDPENHRFNAFLRQGMDLLDGIKSEYEGGRYNTYDVDIAMKELFRTHTTYIDQSQNIRIRNITLSDGSQFEINQIM